MNVTQDSQTSRNNVVRTGIRYEVACDIMGACISYYSERIAKEQDRPKPDLPNIARAQQLLAELRRTREDLNPRDPEGIEDNIQVFGPLARHLYADHLPGSPQALRAARFEQANASLALEGMDVSITDLAIQSRVTLGELSSDEAVALYARRAKS